MPGSFELDVPGPDDRHPARQFAAQVGGVFCTGGGRGDTGELVEPLHQLGRTQRRIERLAQLARNRLGQPGWRNQAVDTFGDHVRQSDLASVVIGADARAIHAILRIAEMRAAESISLRVMNLRVMNLGGITNTLRAVAVCEAAGLNYRFGAIFGSRVMHAHTLHLACTLRAPAFAHEFSEFSLFLDDPFEGLTLTRGAVGLSAGAGTGMRLRDSGSATAAT